MPDGGVAATSPDGGPGRSAFDSLRASVDRGEISQDSARVLMRQLRGGPEGGGFRPQQAGDEGAQGLAMQRATRRAFVFVFGEDGVPTPRPIMIGLNDWDFTEVVSGLEEGEEIAVIGAAQLRATQDAFLERIRSRSTPFGGGGRGRGGR